MIGTDKQWMLTWIEVLYAWLGRDIFEQEIEIGKLKKRWSSLSNECYLE